MTESLRALADELEDRAPDADNEYQRGRKHAFESAAIAIRDFADRLASPGAGAVERFEFVRFLDDDHAERCAMRASEDGEWVRYSALAARDAEIAGLRENWRLAMEELGECTRKRCALTDEAASLRQRMEAAEAWSALWYFVMDEAPQEFAQIVANHSPAQWHHEAHSLMRAKYPAAQQAEPTGGNTP